MVSFRCFCAGSRVFACSVIHKALGQCGKAKKASGKKKSRHCNRERAKNRGKREEESL